MAMLSVSSRRADAGGGRSRRHPKGLGPAICNGFLTQDTRC